ncbi:hypothetical protein TWF281_009841 [Arthrobotrys megalospora]
MLSKIFLISLVASINAIPVPKPQTPDYNTLDTCPNNGAIVCSPDGRSFYLCNFGRAVPMGSVAAGTTCMNGKIYTVGASAGPTPEPEPQPTAMPSYAPEPTSSELVVPSSMETKPTGAPMNPKPEPQPVKDEVTSTIITTVGGTTTSTSTLYLTVTGYPPSMTTAAQPAPTSEPSTGTDGFAITPAMILQIGPDAKSCPREGPNGDLAPEECATADHAAPFITKAFAEYKINTIGEAASILSLMMFETGDFQYNRNHFAIPGGNPGQGTRNMMSPSFVLQYAQTFGSTDSIKPGLTPQNIGTETAEIKNKVLALVLGDDRTWASGAWFYKTYEPCAAVMSDLQKTPVSVQAWKNYITKCVETTVTDDRLALFTRAVTALGGTSVA